MAINNKQKSLIFSILILFIVFVFLLNHTSKANLGLQLVEEYNITDSGSIKYQRYSGYYKPFEKYIDISVTNINLNDQEISVKPVISTSLDTVQKIAQDNNALVAINGGFFDHSNEMSVSNVKIAGKVVAEPKDNKNLTSNPDIKPYLRAIYNRSEFKVLNCEGKIDYAIDTNSKLFKGCTAYHSLGGGPKLVPEINLEEEAFVTKNGKILRDPINAYNQDTRVALGLTPNKHLIFIIANAGFYKDSYYGLTIKELSSLIKFFGVSSALNYDGGSSSTMFVNLPNGKNKLIIGDVNNKGERIQPKVKTALIVSLRKKIAK